MRMLVFTVICLAVGYLAGLMTRQGVNTWYMTIKKPFFTPPNRVFFPVWTALYILMGAAAGLVWSCVEFKPTEVKRALRFFFLQLLLNAVWSYLFFCLLNPLLALIEIILLWLIVYETYLKFRTINRVAGWLFLPYLGWVAFAAVLNGSIWWLNL